MLILVMNSGSSSIKYKLFEVAHRRVMASGLAEKIGESSSILTHAYMTAAGEEKKHVEETVVYFARACRPSASRSTTSETENARTGCRTSVRLTAA